MYLHQQENKTEYLNQLINNDRITKLDKDYINNKIQELKIEIKELEKLKNKPALENKKIWEIVNYFYELFLNHDRLILSDKDNLFWFEKAVIPKLKREGITYYTPQDLLTIFTNAAKKKKLLLPAQDKNE